MKRQVELPHSTIQGWLIDLDGTVYLGDSLLPGAVEAVRLLRAAGVPFLFSTNTSRKSRADVVSALHGMGLEVAEAEVYTAPVAAAQWLRRHELNRIQPLISERTFADFSDFELTGNDPEAVLVGDLGAGFTFERLNAAFRSLRNGARLVAIHKNRFWLPSSGPTLDAGPFVAALEYATGVQAALVGKPATEFFEAAVDLLGVERAGVVVVGDDLESDIRGGRDAGLQTCQVRSGKYDEVATASAPAGEAPSLVVDCLVDIVREALS